MHIDNTLVLASLGGCAQAHLNENADVPRQKDYRTGSNLPVGERDKSGVGVVDKDGAQDLIRPKIVTRPGSGG